MTDSFARLLESSTGKGQSILPHESLSKTNYNEVDSGNIKAANDQIDNALKDNRDRYNSQISLINFMAKKRTKQEQQLLTIVEKGVQINRWRKESAKNWADFNDYSSADIKKEEEKKEKLNIEGVIKKEDYKDTGERHLLNEYDANNWEPEGMTQEKIDAFNIENKRFEAANDEETPVEWQIQLGSGNSVHSAKLDNDSKSDSELLVGFQTMLPLLSDVRFYDAETDQYISYNEAMDSDDIQTRGTIPRLLQKMYAEYATANEFHTLGKRYVYRRLWKGMKQDLDTFHQKNLNIALSSSKQRATNKRRMSLANELIVAHKNSNTAVRDVLFGEYGYASRFNTSNTNGLAETAEALIWLIDKEYIDPNIILSAIDLPFIQKGTQGKETTLEKLNPALYHQLQTKATTKASSKNYNEERTAAANIKADVIRIIEESDGDDAKLLELALPLIKEYGTRFPFESSAVWNSLKTALDKDESLALSNEVKLYQAWLTPGRRLDKRWLKGLAPERKKFWTAKGDERGWFGMSEADQNYALRTLWKINNPLYSSGEVNLNNLRQSGNTALPLAALTQRFHENYNAAINTLSLKKEYQDLNKLYPAALQLAITETERQLKLPNTDPKHLNIIESGVSQTQFTLNETRELQNQLEAEKKKIETDQNAWIYNNEYNNSIEEYAINEYLKYKRGEIPNIPSYFRVLQQPFTKINAAQLADQRVLSTQKLREDTGEELINQNENDIEGMDEENNIELNNNKSSLPRYIVQPKHTAQILEKFNIHEDVDYVGSERNPQKRSKKPSNALGDQKLSQLTLRDLLAYRYDNEYLRLGKYGLTWDAVLDQQQAQNIDLDLPFDDNLQNQIMLGRILQKRNESSSGATLDDTYRRVTTNWTQDDKDLFNSVLGGYIGPSTNLTPVINEDQPYYAVETLLPGVTKWLLHFSLRSTLPPIRPEDDPSLTVDRKRLQKIIEELEETPVIQ